MEKGIFDTIIRIYDNNLKTFVLFTSASLLWLGWQYKKQNKKIETLTKKVESLKGRKGE